MVIDFEGASETVACGNNKVSRGMLAAAPTGPRINAVNVARYAAIARGAMDQAKGLDIPDAHAQRRVVAKATGPKADIPRAQAQELLDLMKRPGLKEDTSLFSPKRSQKGKLVDTCTSLGRARSCNNIYFGGVGRPDGLGHGHAVIQKDGSLKVVRTPYDPLRYGARQAAKDSMDFGSTL